MYHVNVSVAGRFQSTNTNLTKVCQFVKAVGHCGPEIAKVALHVSGGNERKALELCMSGSLLAGKECFVSTNASPSKTFRWRDHTVF